MNEVVDSIRHVTDIMGDHSASQSIARYRASQSSGHDMDNATQQNARWWKKLLLLRGRCRTTANLAQVVSVFKMHGAMRLPMRRNP